MNWKGVMPAITTCFDAQCRVDTGFIADHCRWMIDNGCTGIVALGSLGERATLIFDKKVQSSVFGATALPCMLYNNLVSYGTDFLPDQIVELPAENENLESVKESSTDARQVTAIRALLRDRLQLLVGVDDAIVEGAAVGATGRIAGLANAFPRESAELFNVAQNGEPQQAFDLYRWFLPLLRTDTVAKFIQLIKLAQSEVSIGNARVREPRLELTGQEL